MIFSRLGLFCLLLSGFSAQAFELIAHRGIHQTFEREDLDSQTCTATRILPPTHQYLENTLVSVQKAFDLGADLVEIDIHPTTEKPSEFDRLVVFHDWDLNCRTNATREHGCKTNEKSECITDQQSWDYLRVLDIGHGYTSDQGRTFPFRGKALGQMPTFLDTVGLLRKNPEKKLLINVKDKYERTQRLLLQELARVPRELRSRVLVEFQPAFADEFKKLSVPEAVWQGTGSKKCFRDFFLFGWTGYFPKACRNLKFFVPLHQDLGLVSSYLKGYQVVQLLWGWPDRFLERARRHGSDVYLSQVNSEEDLRFAREHDFAGAMTDRIELIAPLLKKKTAPR